MVAGPLAGQMLGDMGADVVKIERPGGGELARGIEPKIEDESFYYLTVNRNKRSLALDVTEDEGRRIFLDLAAKADVVLLNFPPSFAHRYGINYESVQEHNEDVIYCSISAFGSSGPYAEYSGVDTTIQALSGAMSMTRADGTPAMRSGFPFADICATLYAVQGILSALINRWKNDEGEFVDISLLDGVLAGMTTRATYSLATNEPYPPFGRHHNYFAPEGVFEVADGEIQIAVITDRHWRRLCDVLNADDLASDNRFTTVDDRVEHNDSCREAVSEYLSDWTVQELFETLRETGIPVSPLNDTLDVWDDPHVQAREMKQTLSHPDCGEIDTLGFPIKYENIEQRIEQPPPRLGEHTREILRSLGFESESIDGLVSDEIVDEA